MPLVAHGVQSRAGAFPWGWFGVSGVGALPAVWHHPRAGRVSL